MKKLVIKDRDHAERVMGEIHALTAKMSETKALIEQERAAVDQKYGGEVTDTKLELEVRTQALEAWATKNKPAIDSKVISTPWGKFGFRNVKAGVGLLAKWTWEKVLEKLLSQNKVIWIRREPEVDKARILADREIIATEELAAFGMRINDGEEFFVAPKKA